eukprot:4258155-Pleurochrysis_carterae.AAC.1
MYERAHVHECRLRTCAPSYAHARLRLRTRSQAADKLGLYAFLCNADGSFAAHGASPSFAGRTMAEVMEATDNGGARALSPSLLHSRTHMDTHF